ncbi:MAG: hypothetical protein OEY69_01260, partial [Candidatus Krumholzibacteria bacterium]|nr:hypothetical protein [Candidatus Krumholzibacteria bacterium]
MRARGLAAALASIVAAIAVLAAAGAARCQAPEDDPRTVEWVLANQPERVRALFDTLNLTRPGLEAVRRAVVADDYIAACYALLAYYRTAPTAGWLRHPAVPVSERSDARADAMLQ